MAAAIEYACAYTCACTYNNVQNRPKRFPKGEKSYEENNFIFVDIIHASGDGDHRCTDIGNKDRSGRAARKGP